jgi:hypothetical protein
MGYFKDLTRYEYSKNLFKCAGEPLSIGWLERCTPYPKGVVCPDLTAKLLALCKFPVNRYRRSDIDGMNSMPLKFKSDDANWLPGGYTNTGHQAARFVTLTF